MIGSKLTELCIRNNICIQANDFCIINNNIYNAN